MNQPLMSTYVFQAHAGCWQSLVHIVTEWVQQREPLELWLVKQAGRSAKGTEVSWPEFLQALETWCMARGWVVEYESVDDESCAVFYQRTGPVVCVSDGHASQPVRAQVGHE